MQWWTYIHDNRAYLDHSVPTYWQLGTYRSYRAESRLAFNIAVWGIPIIPFPHFKRSQRPLLHATSLPITLNNSNHSKKKKEKEKAFKSCVYTSLAKPKWTPTIAYSYAIVSLGLILIVPSLPRSWNITNITDWEFYLMWFTKFYGFFSFISFRTERRYLYWSGLITDKAYYVPALN